MELRPGYHLTDAGVIPEDWTALSISDMEVNGLLRLFRGKVISKKDIRNHPGHYPIYSSSVHNDGLFGRYGFFMLDEELITWSIDGGGHFFHRPRHKFSVTNVCGYIRVDSTRLNCKFVAEQLQQLHSRKLFDYQIKAHPSVIRGAYTVPLPPLPEQRVIAGALSDVDALLGGLDRLIAKKRNLKQAAMQQLLTGQTRLPDFHGEWAVKSLDSITSRTTGVWGTDAPDERNLCHANIIRAGDISSDGRLTATAPRYVSPQELQKAKCEFDDLVITTSGNGLGKLWWCDGRSNIAASNFVRVLRPYPSEVLGRFLSYALRTGEGLRQLQEHTATSAYPNLRPTYFSTAWIPMPSKPEQAAIAAVLSDMDAELRALEARRDKTRALKQAMMQELLTGRTRLPPIGIGDA